MFLYVTRIIKEKVINLGEREEYGSSWKGKRQECCRCRTHIYEILKKIKLKFFKMTNLLYVCVCVYVCVYVCCELSEIWSVKKTEMFFGTFKTKCAIM